jgi:hypothetical protein
MSDPGGGPLRVDGLPADVAALCRSEAEGVQADGIAACPEAPLDTSLTPPWLRA